MTFTLKKKYLLGLASWLQEQQLAGRKSRHRTRFVDKLREAYTKTNDERKEIGEKYAKKDEKGKPKIKEIEGRNSWDMTKANEDKFYKEIEDLYEEDYKLDITNALKEEFEAVKDVVLNTNYQFGPGDNTHPSIKSSKIQQAEHYDAWCEAFEAA